MSKRTFVLGKLYRHPSQSVVDFLVQFKNCENYIVPKSYELICMDDFNINALESYGLSQLDHKPTRYALNKTTAIDLYTSICSNNILINQSQMHLQSLAII